MTHGEGIDAALFRAGREWPDRVAFRCKGEVLTFDMLLARAKAMAVCLAEEGVKKGDRVGIAMTKGLEMPVAVYGIWLSGAAFVPLDPSAPVSRHAGILRDCEVNVVIGADRNAPLLRGLAEETGVTIIGTLIDGLQCRLPAQDVAEFQPVPNASDDVAYIIFTSGSTGPPKGITHTHRSGRSFAETWSRHYGLTSEDVFFCTVPLHFDLSFADFFTPPMSGACTELVPEMMQLFPASLASALEESGATIWSTVPFLIIQMVESGAPDQRDFSRLRWLIYAGEPMPAAKLPGIRAAFDADLSNSYGPTELNQVTQYTVPRDHPVGSAIPIGHVLDYAEVAVSDQGELMFSGPMTMVGYWNRPDLNERAFAVRDGKRFYLTGDMGERREDGLWILHGRGDRQTKIRGNRVELDEIEAVLAAHPAVSEAGVVTTPDRLALTAFVTLVPGHDADTGDIRSHCADRLPPYAVPSNIIIRGQFARTGTGKIDRRALVEETP